MKDIETQLLNEIIDDLKKLGLATYFARQLGANQQQINKMY